MSRSLMRSGVSVGLATAVASAFNYGTNMALGRWLGAQAFGDAALIVSSLLLLSAVATGIQLSVARAIVKGRNAAGVHLLHRRVVVVGLVLGGAIVLGAPMLASLFHTATSVPFVLLGCGVPWYLSLSVRRGVLQAAGDFGRLAATMVVEALGRTAITVGLLAAGLGAPAAAAGLLGSFVLAWAVGARANTVARGLIINDAGEGSGSSQAPMVMLLVAQVLIANGDVLVVTAVLPRQAGVYAAVAMIGRMVYVAAWAVVTVVFPRLAEARADDAQRRLFRQAVMATCAIGGAMTLGAAVGGEPLLSGLLGAEYAGGATLLWPYALATTLFAVANLVSVADVAAGARRAPAWMLAGGAIQTASLVLLVPNGLDWAVWVQVVVMAALLVAVSSRRLIAGVHSRVRIFVPASTLLAR